MNGLVTYLRATEHIADLRRATDRERLARHAKPESLVDHVIAQLRHRERSRDDRRPAWLTQAESSRAASDVAVAQS